MENAIWSATLWGPTWLRGGLLFLMTARTFDAERRQADSTVRPTRQRWVGSTPAPLREARPC
jgi:hypothetical protein